MPIHLDKILSDIANEKVLHPNYPVASKKEIDDAWTRVGKNNNLSVHESRSIFKVLQKKYEQEKTKENSTWKLFAIMDKIHQKIEIKTEFKEEENTVPMEDDEEYEMLEVHEEDDASGQATNTVESASDTESPSKQQNATTSPEKEEKATAGKTLLRTTTNTQSEQTQSTKLLNSMASHTPRTNVTITAKNAAAASAASLQKKGVTLKKTQVTSSSQAHNRLAASSSKAMTGSRGLEVGKTIQLPESLKRKLSEDPVATGLAKKFNQQHHTSATTFNINTKACSPQNPLLSSSTQLIQIKQERPECLDSPNAQEPNSNLSTTPGINVITIPANPTGTHGLVNGLINTGGPSSSTAATVASTSTNGFSPRLEEIDFRNDIIFDATHSNGSALGGKVTNASDIINLGNFDNSLPPTFFKNLCNSSRHEALGLYVANVMNRLRSRSAAKLELAILRAMIEIQNEELEQ